MTSYYIKIKKCPNCECEFTKWNVASCNTIDAIFFTDGYVHGPMYDVGCALLACPGCKRYFWQEDVPTIGSMRDSEYFQERELQSLPKAIHIYERDFETLLHQAIWQSDAQEKYIRIRYWWSCNNDYRGSDFLESRFVIKPWLHDSDCHEKINEEFKLSSEQEINLRRLLQLLDTNNQNERITKAEVLRESGQFEDCLKQLDQPFDEGYIPTIDTIKNLAICKNRQVGIIGKATKVGIN